MINFRKQITAILKTVTSRVYFQAASETVGLPYIVYDLTSINLYGEYDTVLMDVDIYDYGDTSDQIETLLRSLRTTLRGRTFHTEDFSAVIYGENILPLSDTDPMIQRRRASYQINLFEYTDRLRLSLLRLWRSRSKAACTH